MEKRRAKELTKFDRTDILLAHIATFLPKNRSDSLLRILEGMKRKDLRKLASNATDELKTCDDTKKRWCELVECDCQQEKNFFDENHDHVLTGDLRIIINSKLRKLVSKGASFREAMSINWNRCKIEIEIGLDSSIERIVSKNPKVMMEEFADWKRKVLQEVDNKIISLKGRNN